MVMACAMRAPRRGPLTEAEYPDNTNTDHGGHRPGGRHPDHDGRPRLRRPWRRRPDLRRAAAEGITTAFPIQTLALPIALAGHDIIGQARTGTDKTLAFGIPLLQRLGQPADRRPLAPGALVVVPTRELAIQVA